MSVQLTLNTNLTANNIYGDGYNITNLKRSNFEAIPGEANNLLCNDVDGKVVSTSQIKFTDGKMEINAPMKGTYVDYSGGFTFGQNHQILPVTTNTTNATATTIYADTYVDTTVTGYLVYYEITAIYTTGVTVKTATFGGSCKVTNNHLDTPAVTTVSEIMNNVAIIDDTLSNIGGITLLSSPVFSIQVNGIADKNLTWQGIVRISGKTDKVVVNEYQINNQSSSIIGGIPTSFTYYNSSGLISSTEAVKTANNDTEIVVNPTSTIRLLKKISYDLNDKFIDEKVDYTTTDNNLHTMIQYSIPNNSVFMVSLLLLSKNTSNYDASFVDRQVVFKCDGSGVITTQTVSKNQTSKDASLENLAVTETFLANVLKLNVQTNVSANISHSAMVKICLL